MLKHSDLTKAERAARLHHFHRIRAAGTPALAAWVSALRHIHFVETLRAEVKAAKKRSRAAKKGWKTRKSQTFA